jgi:[ribosomal protein S18]-alanine N-acetyltransferase
MASISRQTSIHTDYQEEAPLLLRSPLTFSHLTLSDLALVHLQREYAQEVVQLEPQIYPHGWSPSLIFSEFDKKISFRPALLCNDQVVAYSFNYIIEEELHILNLAVRPEAQGRGIGSYFLKTILEEARKRSVSYCFLEVRRSNIKAQNLYYSAGFVSNGVRRSYYCDNQEDAILMELTF